MRRRSAPKRQILPDPLFNSEVLAKFINVLMLDGKKSIAEKVIYGALDLMLKRHKGEKDEEGEGGSSGSGGIRTDEKARARAIKLFEEVLGKLRPRVEVKSRRVGGATYQVPIEVRADRSTALAMRWLVEYSRKRGEKGMMQRLAGEMLDALQDRGGAFKKRDDVHKMAKANQAFAHYRW